jgi:putative transposase
VPHTSRFLRCVGFHHKLAESLVTVKTPHRCYPHRVTRKLHRYYGGQHLHFITCSCYRREPILGTAERRDRFVNILEEARSKYRFVVHGYVVMPEHFHLLITEPEVGDPSVVMKVIKERFSKQVHSSEVNARRAQSSAQNASEWGPHADPEATRIWQKRFYDFNVWSAQKKTENVKYMHWNPVKRGLVERPEQWRWSSLRAYLYSEREPVRVNFQEWELEIKSRPLQSFGNPLIRTEHE